MTQDIKNRIRKLAKEKNAIILAHNYQPPDIQEIADLCGDSLELSIRASKTGAGTIVFCGVHFMAETASILCPEKKVLLPRLDAGCPMADMVTAGALKERIAQNPEMPVVTYVNSTADVKALTTICCTSANSVNVINSLDAPEILMVPDRNLARYTAAKTSRTIQHWDGCCPIHDRLSPEAVLKQKQAHPEAIFMAHPECRMEILEMADLVTSTSGMLRHARESDHQSFIVGTEVGLLYPLQKASPQKRFYPASEDMLCPDMKKITLEDVLNSLIHLAPEVKVPEHFRVPAFEAVRRMIEL
ncbi:MAG: quinolinate synthase NadA [Desulfobacterales bacterium]|nr:quinolinate synthase NadA [Desulfobacterales bacterium]